MERRKENAAFLQGGKGKKAMSMENHIPQGNPGIFLESDLQENQQQCRVKGLNDKASLHLCEDDRAVHQLSQRRVQPLVDSMKRI